MVHLMSVNVSQFLTLALNIVPLRFYAPPASRLLERVILWFKSARAHTRGSPPVTVTGCVTTHVVFVL